MAKRDFYEVLGVPRNTSADELKKAYRNLAKQYHPDKNPDDKEAEKKFKEVSEAYDILRDTERRNLYDQHGHAAFEAGMGSGSGGAGYGHHHTATGGFADLFEEVFGEFMGSRRGRAGGARRGGDLQYNMPIPLEMAFSGGEKTINVNIPVACKPCKGSGAEGAKAPVDCSTCHGRGQVRTQQGFFTIERACPSCGGMGQIIKEKCRQCRGMGRVQRDKTLKVSIPPGVEDGTRIRLSGEGEAGMQGAPAGDLYVFIEIPPHALFQRQGADMHCKVPIVMTTAALGGSIDVPTIDGKKTRVKIPEGTQSGNTFRLRNQGMTILRRSSRGDMYVHVHVETPVKLSKKQKKLLQEFSEEDNDVRTSPQHEGFFAKVKDFLDSLQE